MLAKQIPIFTAIVFSALLFGCQNQSANSDAGNQSAKRMSNKWFYAHWKEVTVDQYPTLSEKEVDGLMVHPDVLLTDEFVPEDWPNREEMLQFFYNEKKETYWSHRWTVLNADDTRKIHGPITFPEN